MKTAALIHIIAALRIVCDASGAPIQDPQARFVRSLSEGWQFDLSAGYGRDRAARFRTSVHVAGNSGLTLDFKSRIGVPIVSSINIVWQ